ncbi:UxaA family hydrolase [Paenibacillus rigui]|uniref:Altronate hydrolase n=1 Tax=Paenibacillus rigui TaxID=554312 RepID=A0A229UTP0_9BACL|nr:altronate dehydratase family protein [Paenibacillus rigui]OXM86754.1 altronate hydrolase [Paenibacillus rigui]
MKKSDSAIVIHPEDSVCITTRSFTKGETVAFEDKIMTLQEDIPSGHKVARRHLSAGEHVLKFGYSIGRASSDIQEGQWVHTHNLRTNLEGKLNYSYKPAKEEIKRQPSDLTFQGYIRSNGEAGIRNEIWIINTVGCINKTAEILARMGNERFKDSAIDGIFHFAHPFGCSQLGDDLSNTQKILSNLVHHPNAAGVLVLGLGCENNSVNQFMKVIDEFDQDRVKFLISQEVEDELETGMDLIKALVEYAESFKRQPVPISALKIGMKCGGSDGFSGITANPLVGSFSDLLVSYGGTTIMTEVPEMFGAETILMNRAQDEAVFNKTVALINDFKNYYISHNQVVYENPSPGNKQGGITTLEEKSLGCVQKGGHAYVADVLPYGSRVVKNGLNLVQGPGNDLVSVTALAASGAHIVLFTTGRGTPFGGPVPTVKISTNSLLCQKKSNWIDFNAGQLLEDVGFRELTDDLFHYVLQVASGEIATRNEQNGFKEIAIFKDGVTL